ncbi:S8 family peptidase [Streptomyces ossamyceticus]|nr:S8 family peptidase [Streptomyces ossamyceticus]
MSQQHPGRRRAGGRAASLLAPALVGGLILISGPAVQAAPAHQAPNGPAEATRPTYSAGTYLVQLADQPVATSSRTAPAQGERLNTRSQAVRDYVGHLKRERDKVLDEVEGVKPLTTYKYVLNGFAADLTADQASELARIPGVVSLTRNEMRQITTTATADSNPAKERAQAGAAAAGTHAAGTLPVPDTAEFLGLKDRKGLYSKFRGGQRNAGEGLIIGVLDTGIDTSNPSLRALPEPRPDAEVIAKKWKGGCDPGDAAEHRVTCNNKVIGAQYFNKGLPEPTETDWASPMDADSHGTHTATTAAGNIDVPATVPDTGISGRISGLAPAARIAAYKVCWSAGCPSVDLVAGFDKAVADGVDVINYSIGGGNGDPTTNPVYMAMYNAARAGVFVSASAGNDGPGTVSNNVPWVATVAASTHDVGYRTSVTLGNGTVYEGVGISADAAPSAPLVDAAKAARSGVEAAQAELCKPDTLDPAVVKGAIVLCERGDNARIDKSAQVKAAGGVGMVLYNATAAEEEVADAHTIPSVHVDSATGAAVKAYAAGSGATAEIGAARGVEQRAPQIAGFSSGGFDQTSDGDLIKPDMTAPGVDIVAGTTPGGGEGAFKGEQGMMSGTSMAAPHVAGLALLLRSLHPDWSPMEVKSALMTTATTRDSAGKPIRRVGADGPATPLDYGSGHVVPNRADDPGLVYDSTSADWTAYSCALGDGPVTDDGSDACATARKIDPSDFNSPTISIGDLIGKQTVTRTVTNISDRTGVYTAKLQTPHGYKAQVSPRILAVKPGASATYKITFTRTDAAYGDWAFGSITWSDTRHHNVRSAVALRATPLATAAEATGKGSTGSVTLTAKPGWDGVLTTAVKGLHPDTAKTGTLTGTDPDFAPGQSPLTAATARTEVTVPEGTDFARVAIRSADHLAGSDVDLWVLDKDGRNLAAITPGNDEHVDLTEPGTYEVYVNQYALPQGATSQPYTLHTWLIGKDTAPEHTATVTPAEQRVPQGTTAEVTVSWRDLPAGRTYLGLVRYGDGTDTVGGTVLTVTS